MRELVYGSQQAIWLLREGNMCRGSEQSAEKGGFGEHGGGGVVLVCTVSGFTRSQID